METSNLNSNERSYTNEEYAMLHKRAYELATAAKQTISTPGNDRSESKAALVELAEAVQAFAAAHKFFHPDNSESDGGKQ